jgi:antitoxin CptB
MLICSRLGSNPEADICASRPYINAPGFVRAFGVWNSMTGLTRSSDGLDPRRRRLLYQSWHRGIREMDLIMGRFAEAFIENLSTTELDELERLIEVPDQELLGWVTGEFAIPQDYNGPLFRRLREFHWRSAAARGA